jgi:hypothetical protein
VFLQLEGLGVAKILHPQVLSFYEMSYKSNFLMDVKAARMQQTGNACKIVFWGDL